jgi:nucleolar protein 56
MQVRTWFAIFTLDNNMITEVELFQKDLDAILGRVLSEPLLLRGKVAGNDLCDLALKYGFVASREEYDTMLHELNIGLAKKKIAQSMTPDKQIIAAVEAIDDIDETCNILAERLKEWFLLNFNETKLKGSELAHHILEMKEPAPELTIMQSLASGLLGLYESRFSIEEYLKKSMHKTAPNLTNIAGYLLGARLLSIAGSLPKLASMPSSTVQVIGASNALFKHLKGKAPSPKHGVIFRHPYVNTAPKRLRGKIARAVASKISLAARYDMYSGKINDGLPSELEKKVANIRKQAKKLS